MDLELTVIGCASTLWQEEFYENDVKGIIVQSGWIDLRQDLPSIVAVDEA